MESAKAGATDRIRRLVERISHGEPFPDNYSYGSRPLREEILRTIEGDIPGQPLAIVTRNSYGARVLNAATLLFLDIDLKRPTSFQRLLRIFRAGGNSQEELVLTWIREALGLHRRTTFRIYRTAAGFRAVAIDRDFDPAGSDTQDLMNATGTDVAFSRLCSVQRSFRARLSPKPWRARIPPPPDEHPRTEGESIKRFESWLSKYEEASMSFATCRYLETVGSGHPRGYSGELIQLHDRETRCNEPLPLA